jgi:unsaturated chondroitin disaccharide hydrolase
MTAITNTDHRASAPDFVARAIERALETITHNLSVFGTHFMDDTTVANVYRRRRWTEDNTPVPDGANIGWTTGFWTGLLWLAFELSGDRRYADGARAHLPGYRTRLEQRINVDHHDLGFLYSPSCVAAYRLTADPVARDTALLAAQTLMSRFLPGAGIIQAWGDLEDPRQRGRIIVDCLLNLPLLYWASRETGDPKFAQAAVSHAEASMRHLVRSDDTTFHTFHFDPESGAPLRGSTAQGWTDDSCWARGQAWGIYGFAVNARLAKRPDFAVVSARLAHRFLAHLPDDLVPYWDLSLPSDNEPRDSSAGVIAACGMFELADASQDEQERTQWRSQALALLAAAERHCAPRDPHSSNALLLHGVYSKPDGRGVDEGTLWGDYFYLEALVRAERLWTAHW